MESLDSGSPRIEYQHIVESVIDNLKDMGMPAYKNIRAVSVNELKRLMVISSRITSYMYHEHTHSSGFHKLYIWMDTAYEFVIAIAVYTF